MARPGPLTAPARPYAVHPDASVYRDRVGEVACVLTQFAGFCGRFDGHELDLEPVGVGEVGGVVFEAAGAWNAR